MCRSRVWTLLVPEGYQQQKLYGDNVSCFLCVSGYVVNFLEWKLGYDQQQGLEGGVWGGGGGGGWGWGDRYNSVSRLDGSQDTNKGKS